MEINIIELASELAHKDLKFNWVDTIKIYEDESEETYTEEAQDIFNEFYDDYLDIIEQCKI